MENARSSPVLGSTLTTLYRLGAVGTLTDGQLLEWFLARNDPAASEAAFSVLVERHGAMVLGVCQKMLGDPHDAHDAFQATFLVLVSKARSIRRREAVGGWLFGIARRVAARAQVEASRRRRHLQTLFDDQPASRDDIGGRIGRSIRGRLWISHRRDRPASRTASLSGRAPLLRGAVYRGHRPSARLPARHGALAVIASTQPAQGAAGESRRFIRIDTPPRRCDEPMPSARACAPFAGPEHHSRRGSLALAGASIESTRTRHGGHALTRRHPHAGGLKCPPGSQSSWSWRSHAFRWVWRRRSAPAKWLRKRCRGRSCRATRVAVSRRVRRPRLQQKRRAKCSDMRGSCSIPMEGPSRARSYTLLTGTIKVPPAPRSGERPTPRAGSVSP